DESSVSVRRIPEVTPRYDTPLRLVRQLENVERWTDSWKLDFGHQYRRYQTRTGAAEAGGYRNVLLAIGTECHGKALHRRIETRLPENFSGLHVDGFEGAIEIAHKRNSAGR